LTVCLRRHQACEWCISGRSGRSWNRNPGRRRSRPLDRSLEADKAWNTKLAAQQGGQHDAMIAAGWEAAGRAFWSDGETKDQGQPA
jgi:hypothetical protein